MLQRCVRVETQTLASVIVVTLDTYLKRLLLVASSSSSVRLQLFDKLGQLVLGVQWAGIVGTAGATTAHLVGIAAAGPGGNSRAADDARTLVGVHVIVHVGTATGAGRCRRVGRHVVWRGLCPRGCRRLAATSSSRRRDGSRRRLRLGRSDWRGRSNGLHQLLLHRVLRRRRTHHLAARALLELLG